MKDNKILIEKFLEPLNVCKKYKPKFGLGNSEEGVSLSYFLDLYGNDPFYSWCGLDSKLMYSAHKAAGGMTSIYRQIGKGCEELFKEIIFRSTGYEDRKFVEWSYEAQTKSGIKKTLSLDGRLELSEIKSLSVKNKVENWMESYCNLISAEIPTKGIVFEVRQGYKSKDSKRQNADIDNVAVSWSQGYLPVFAIFSGQIDPDLVLRYRNNRAGILIGILNHNPTESLFSFCSDILEFDLAEFFTSNSEIIKHEIHETLELLLNP